MGIPALPFCKVALRVKKPKNKATPRQLNTIGDHIRKRRNDLNLLQKDVAKHLNVDKATVTNWEKNHSQPRLYLIPEIIKFLGYIPFDLGVTPLNNKIKLYRLIRGLSLKKLAKEIGIDPTTLAKWERNKGKPYYNFKIIVKNFFLSKFI